MAEQLKTGQFFGESLSRSLWPGAVLTELSHVEQRRLPLHTHESAFFLLLVRGGYAEWFGNRALEYRPLSVGIHPPGFQHRDAIRPGGALFFSIEVKNHWLERLREQDPRAALRPEISNSELSWLALRLYRAMKRQTLSPLLVEGIVLELLAEAARVAPARERGSPPWMARMLELLHDEFWRPWTLAAVAQEIGVHPVYLSRAFRRVHRQTLGEYLHRVRVQFAIEHLADESAGLVDVALRVGFADQSHFCRVFRSLTGCSPGAYRKLLRVAGTPS